MSSLYATVFHDDVCFKPEPVFINVYGAKESIPSAYVDWWEGTTYRVVVPGRLKRSANTGSILGCDKGTKIKRRPSFTSIPILASQFKASS
jgi:hypothetical protein